jgi:hypothetical protein
MPPPRNAETWTRFAASLYQGLSAGDFLHGLTVRMEKRVGIGMVQWTTIKHATGQPIDNCWSTPCDPKLIDEYVEHIQPVDPRIHASLANFGAFLPCWSILDPFEFDKSPVVGDWTDRKDVNRRWGAACIWDIDAAHAGLLAFLRPRTEGAFQMEELAPVKRLRSHIRRAAQLHFLFRDAPGGRLFDRAWGAQNQSVLLLGRGKRLLGANGAAHKLLRDGDVFTAAWGELIAKEPWLAATFDNALAAARQFDLTIHPRSVTFIWPRKDGQSALHAEVMALPGLGAETGIGERVELLLFARTLPRQRMRMPHVTNLLSGP